MNEEQIESLARVLYDNLNAQASFVGDYKAQYKTCTTLDGEFDLKEAAMAVVRAYQTMEKDKFMPRPR